MRRRIKYVDSYGCNYLSVEYGSNNCKYYGQPGFNHHLFGHRNKLEWLLRNCIGDCFSRLIDYSYGDRITGNNLYRRFKYTDSQWRNLLSMEYGPDNGKHYG